MTFSAPSIEPWLFQVEPYPEESFGHFLGRFCRVNCLRSEHLSIMLGLKANVVSYWQTPSRRRIPSPTELKTLSHLTGVEVNRLGQMLVSPCTHLHLQTRLCALCYADTPCHKLTWQEANLPHCDRHQHRLLFACPACETGFRLPAYWDIGQCEYCWLPFSEMGAYQLPVDGALPSHESFGV